MDIVCIFTEVFKPFTANVTIGIVDFIYVFRYVFLMSLIFLLLFLYYTLPSFIVNKYFYSTILIPFLIFLLYFFSYFLNGCSKDYKRCLKVDSFTCI